MYTDDGELNAAALAELLTTHAVLVGGTGRGIGTHSSQDDVNAFMDGVLADRGASYRALVQRNVTSIMQVHQDAPNPVLGIQLGDEINGANYSSTIKGWAEHAGKPYPHPGTDRGDPTGANDRGYIGYLVEYYLAPSIEAINDATMGFPPEHQIKIMCGWLVDARDATARTVWLPELLDYVLAGEFAPTLAGQRVADLVDHLSVHNSYPST